MVLVYIFEGKKIMETLPVTSKMNHSRYEPIIGLLESQRMCFCAKVILLLG